MRRVGVKGCSQTRCPPVTTTGRIGRPSRRARLKAPGWNATAEDGALGEEEDALSCLDGSAGADKEGAGGWEGSLGTDEEVAPAGKLVAEDGERGDLVSGDGGEGEGQAEKGETVGEALVKGDDHVLLIRVDVFEPVHPDAQTDQEGGEARPPALGGPAGSPPTNAGWAPVRQQRSESQDQPGRTEEDEDGNPGPEPLRG